MVVLLKPAALGDTALMSASLLALRRAYPWSRLIVAAGPDNAELAEALPHVDAVAILKPQHVLASLVALRRLKADVVIDCDSWPHVSAILTALSGAAYTIGYRSGQRHRHLAYDAVVDHRRTEHEVCNQSRLVEALTGTPSAAPYLAAVAGRDAALAHVERYVVFHPWASGAGKRLKEWPVQHWAELASRLVRRRYAIVLTGAPADQPDSRRLAEAVDRDIAPTRVIDLAGRTPIRGLLGLLDGADAVVSVNTGVMHVAAALGRPTVGLSGPTDPARWGPYGAHTRSVSPSGGRHSYLHLGHEYPRDATSPMHHLAVDQVEAALASIL